MYFMYILIMFHFEYVYQEKIICNLITLCRRWKRSKLPVTLMIRNICSWSFYSSQSPNTSTSRLDWLGFTCCILFCSSKKLCVFPFECKCSFFSIHVCQRSLEWIIKRFQANFHLEFLIILTVSSFFTRRKLFSGVSKLTSKLMETAVEAIVSRACDWQNDKTSTSISRHTKRREARENQGGIRGDSASMKLCENFYFLLYWWTC